jgi:hypothetical protein
MPYGLHNVDALFLNFGEGEFKVIHPFGGFFVAEDIPVGGGYER